MTKRVTSRENGISTSQFFNKEFYSPRDNFPRYKKRDKSISSLSTKFGTRPKAFIEFNKRWKRVAVPRISVGPSRSLTRRRHFYNVFRSLAFWLQNTNVSKKILHSVFP